MQGMPLLLHRRLSMVWVSHFCGSTRTLGKNALVKSRWERILDGFRNQAITLKCPAQGP
jgi:hypothetical protein